MKNIIITIFAITTLFFASCEEEQVVCTTEFVTVNLVVKGDSLTDYYTIRLITNDTIRSEEPPYTTINGDISYVVLTDGMRDELKGKLEPFIFKGQIDGETVISEEYKLGANDCHIYKDSGKDEIVLIELD